MEGQTIRALEIQKEFSDMNLSFRAAMILANNDDGFGIECCEEFWEEIETNEEIEDSID